MWYYMLACDNPNFPFYCVLGFLLIASSRKNICLRIFGFNPCMFFYCKYISEFGNIHRLKQKIREHTETKMIFKPKNIYIKTLITFLVYPLYFMLKSVEFVEMPRWILMGRRNWRPSFCFVICVVDICFSLHGRYFSFCGGDFEEFYFIGRFLVVLYTWLFSYLTLNVVGIWWSVRLVPPCCYELRICTVGIN
jgi:hypothetical protein